MSFHGVKTLGVDVTTHVAHTTQQHELGLRVSDSAGREFVYCASDGATAKQAVTLEAGYVVAAAGNGAYVFGVVPVALPEGTYGWVQVRGVVENALLNTGVSSGAALAQAAITGAKFAAVAAATGGAVGIALEAESGGVGDIYLYGR